MNSPQYLHILTSHLKGRRITSYEGPALPVTKPLHVLNTVRPLKLAGICWDLEQSRTQCYVAEFRHMFRCLFSLSCETLAWKQRTVKNALPKKKFPIPEYFSSPQRGWYNGSESGKQQCICRRSQLCLRRRGASCSDWSSRGTGKPEVYLRQTYL